MSRWELLRSALIPPPLGRAVIVLLMPPVAGFAALALLSAARRLRAERQALNQCRERVEEWTTASTSIGDPEIADLLKGASDDSTVRKAVEAIWRMRGMANPDLEAVGSMLAQVQAAQLGFARVAPNLLLLSGLVGTVFGLAGAIGSVAPQILKMRQVSDPDSLTRALATTFWELRNAFACTIWGIAGALAIGWRVDCTSRAHSAFLADLRDFALRYFAPLVLPRGQAAQLEDVRRLLDESRRFIERVGKTMDKAAGEFERVLNTAGQAMTTSMQELQQVASGMRTSLESVAGDVRATGQTLSNSAEALRTSSDALKEYHTDLRNAYSALVEQHRELQDRIKSDAREQVERIGELQKQFRDSGLEIIASVGRAAERLSEATRSFNDAGSRVSDVGLQVSQTIGHQFGLARERLDETLRALQQALDGHAQEQGQRFGELGEQLRASGSEIAAQIGTIAGNLREATHSFNDAGSRFSEVGLQVSQRIVDDFGRVHEKLAQALSDHRAEMSRVDERIRQVAEFLNDLSGRLDPRLLPADEWAAVRDALTACAAELRALPRTQPAPGETAAPLYSVTDLAAAVADLRDAADVLRSVAGQLALSSGDGQPQMQMLEALRRIEAAIGRAIPAASVPVQPLPASDLLAALSRIERAVRETSRAAGAGAVPRETVPPDPAGHQASPPKRRRFCWPGWPFRWRPRWLFRRK